jgi:hypothetical protein
MVIIRCFEKIKPLFSHSIFGIIFQHNIKDNYNNIFKKYLVITRRRVRVPFPVTSLSERGSQVYHRMHTLILFIILLQKLNQPFQYSCAQYSLIKMVSLVGQSYKYMLHMLGYHTETTEMFVDVSHAWLI